MTLDSELPPDDLPLAAPSLEARVRAALREVIDPEAGLDIVTMGLVYRIEVDGGDVTVVHTLTTRGCPLEGFITQAIAASASRVAGVETVDTHLVWDPTWHPGLIQTETT
ncbi:MAG: metal-sulfur cluster assembly factor [Longimicrobiales bacterium]|nr:metal-sulfur cluster assembly factor [Longimicrobiales bacterium]